jgi:tRNA wybutosine-synthesizing protein 1
MIPENLKKFLKKQHYRLVGKHSAVQICRWTKNSIRNQGVCYKEKFYGIKSHRCCQMTPCVMWCDNKCVHCWRAIEHTLGNTLDKGIDSPSLIIDESILQQRKLLEGFKINPKTKEKTLSKADMKKWVEAQEPNQFAISLSGEPTIYPLIGDLILELRKRKKTSFLVTNGLHPEILKNLYKKNQLPTQLYVSVNTSNKNLYDKFHRSCLKDAWEIFNQTIDLMPKLREKTRTIFRMNLIRDINLKEEFILEYVDLIKRANPLFIEVKGFMSVGFARQRLGYERMPDFKGMEDFCLKLSSALGKDWILLDSHENSRAFLIGRKKDKVNMKIRRSEF